MIYLLSHVVSGIDVEEVFRITRLPTAARWAHAHFCSVCVDVCALVLVLRGPLCSCPVRCGLKEPEMSPLGQLDGDPPWWWRDRLWNHRCPPLSAAARGVLISCTNVCVHFFFTCEHPTMHAKWSRGVWSTGEKRKIDHCSAALGWLKRCTECWENNANQSKARTALAGRTLSHRHAKESGKGARFFLREALHLAGHTISSPRWSH